MTPTNRQLVNGLVQRIGASRRNNIPGLPIVFNEPVNLRLPVFDKTGWDSLDEGLVQLSAQEGEAQLGFRVNGYWTASNWSLSFKGVNEPTYEIMFREARELNGVPGDALTGVPTEVSIYGFQTTPPVIDAREFEIECPEEVMDVYHRILQAVDEILPEQIHK